MAKNKGKKKAQPSAVEQGGGDAKENLTVEQKAQLVAHLKAANVAKNSTEKTTARDGIKDILSPLLPKSIESRIEDQNDPSEFGTPLFEQLFGSPVAETSTLKPDRPNQFDTTLLESTTRVLFSTILTVTPDKHITDFIEKAGVESMGEISFCNEHNTRFYASGKKEVSYNFPEEVNELTFYTQRLSFDKKSKIKSKNTDQRLFTKFQKNNKDYFPTAFACHRGGKASGGHYIAYIKCNDNQWYCYNDGAVNEVTEDAVFVEARTNSVLVKYAAVSEVGLPAKQEVGCQNFGNWCWLNALFTLTLSHRDFQKKMKLLESDAINLLEARDEAEKKLIKGSYAKKGEATKALEASSSEAPKEKEARLAQEKATREAKEKAEKEAAEKAAKEEAARKVREAAEKAAKEEAARLKVKEEEKSEEDQKKRAGAATKIGAVFKGFKARKAAKTEAAAATKIGAVFKGFKVRKAAAAKKALKEKQEFAGLFGLTAEELDTLTESNLEGVLAEFNLNETKSRLEKEFAAEIAKFNTEVAKPATPSQPPEDTAAKAEQKTDFFNKGLEIIKSLEKYQEEEGVNVLPPLKHTQNSLVKRYGEQVADFKTKQQGEIAEKERELTRIQQQGMRLITSFNTTKALEASAENNKKLEIALNAAKAVAKKYLDLKQEIADAKQNTPALLEEEISIIKELTKELKTTYAKPLKAIARKNDGYDSDSDSDDDDEKEEQAAEILRLKQQLAAKEAKKASGGNGDR